MCTTCLLVSALMLFTPAENAVQSNQSQISLAQETQVAITEMINQLPKTSDTSGLRNGLSQLHSQLATAKNDVQAQKIIDNQLISLSQRLSNAPNAEEVKELLEDMLIEDESLVQEFSYTPTVPQAKTTKWGWLR